MKEIYIQQCLERGKGLLERAERILKDAPN